MKKDNAKGKGCHRATGDGVIISPRIELIGSEVKSSSGWPRGEPSLIPVSSIDSGKLLISILNHVRKFYSQ